jgi:hypothetical protein
MILPNFTNVYALVFILLKQYQYPFSHIRQQWHSILNGTLFMNEAVKGPFSKFRLIFYQKLCKVMLLMIDFLHACGYMHNSCALLVAMCHKQKYDPCICLQLHYLTYLLYNVSFVMCLSTYHQTMCVSL